MARTDDDSRDLKTSVGVTATMTAVATRQPDPLVSGPLAKELVRAMGIELFTRAVDGALDFGDIGAGWFPAWFGIRGWAIDQFVAGACREGIRQLGQVTQTVASRKANVVNYYGILAAPPFLFFKDGGRAVFASHQIYS